MKEVPKAQQENWAAYSQNMPSIIPDDDTESKLRIKNKEIHFVKALYGRLTYGFVYVFIYIIKTCTVVIL